MDYRSTGVDIERAERSLSGVRQAIRRTFTKGVVSIPNGFAGAHRSPGEDRLLLASIDGVGSKVTLGRKLNRFHGLGIDLVHHCANDLLVHGGRPLFFLDYVGVGRLDESWFSEILSGLSDGCKSVRCALIGGETAEMPDTYDGEDFDLVGAIVGEVARDELVDGSTIRSGDRLIGLPSTGLHTNGYTLARRIVDERLEGNYAAPLPGTDGSWGDALIEPHRSYGKPIFPLVHEGYLSGMAHITGGGLRGNLGRLLPKGLTAHVDVTAWDRPPVFSALQSAGEVTDEEMFHAFNMGIGFVLVVPGEDVDRVKASLDESGERYYEIGEIRQGENGVRLHGIA